MAAFNTSFYEDPEDEQRRALHALGRGAPLPAATPAPAPQPVEQRPALPEQAPAPAAAAPQAAPAAQPTQEEKPSTLSALQLLAQRDEEPRRQAPQLPEPPMAGGTPSWALAGAAALDMLLNKGRNAGRLIAAFAQGDDRTKYENWKRTAARAKDQSELDNAYARGGRRGGMSPEQLALAAMRLDQGADRLADRKVQTQQGQERLEQGQARMEQQDRHWSELNKAGSATHKAMVDWLVSKGLAKREEIEGIPASKLPHGLIAEYTKNTGPLGEAREQQAAETAGAVSAATLDDRLRIAREGAQARTEVEANSPQFAAQQSERYRQAADQYSKETEQYRAIAHQTMRALNLAGKYKGKGIPGIGPVEGRLAPDDYYSATGNMDALEIRSAQRLMNDSVTRAQTGAAAPMSEQQAIAIMTGSRPGATEAEFMVGMNTIRDYANAQLRAFSVGKDEAAREVLRNHDAALERFVFPQQPAAPAARRPARAPRAPAAPSAPLTPEQKQKTLQDLGI